MTTGDEPSASDPLLGQTVVDRYRLVRRMGEGGMGTVYEAHEEARGRTVAVKILRDKYADRPEVARRLVQEAQLASSIDHDHIVRILDSGTTKDGRPFLVMEHLRGESLADRIRREGALPEPFVLSMAEQAASALAAAHASAIVHRDIKPENLFLVEQVDSPSVKIVDFGISKSLAGEAGDSNMRLTATGMVLGTPLYMSPEQARGDDELDERVDVYALGVILYETLTGEVPFRANNYLGVISQVLSAELIPPRQLRPELSISPGVERIVMRAMARDRSQRYPTMAAMSEDLTRVRTGADFVVEPPKEAPPTRFLWPVVVVLGVVTVGVLTVPLWDPKRTSLPTITVSPSLPRSAKPVPTTLLSISSEPPGAQIVVRGALLGTTPRDVTLPRGPTDVSLTLDGYEPVRTTADVGKLRRLDVPMKAIAVAVHPTTTPVAHPVHNGHIGPPVAKPTSPTSQPGDETLPNPY